MGKTYKTLPDDLFLDDDVPLDDDIDEFDFDDDLDSLLLDAQSKRHKNKRGRRKHPDDFTGSGLHRLPDDWMDFDYSNGNSQDDWR
jgi:hypothetical protein